MAKTEIVIAMKNGGLLHKAAMNTTADVRVGAHEPVKVPLVYGNQLIADHFAYAVVSETSPEPKSGRGTGKNTGPSDDLVADAEVVFPAIES